jgi:disulfide bond formation protein DsbB
MRCAASCKRLDYIFHNASWTGLFLAALSAAALAGAYFSQYVLGLAPCPLCLYQRIPHAVIIILGFGALFLARRHRVKPAAFVIFLSGLAALTGAVIASYHVGVEHHWWASFLEACTADLSQGDLLEKIQQTAAVRCDTVAWSLFGISMAGYNALLSFGMIVYALIASILITRRATKPPCWQLLWERSSLKNISLWIKTCPVRIIRPP